MTTQSILLLVLFLAVLLAAGYPLGLYMAKVAGDAPIRGLGWLQKCEDLLYRLAGVKAGPDRAMGWKRYAIALVVFNTVGAFFVYGLQRLQGFLQIGRASCRERVF